MAKSILPKVTPELIALVLLVVVYLNRELVMSKVNELVALATGKKEEEFSVMGQNKYLDMAIQVSLVVLVVSVASKVVPDVKKLLPKQVKKLLL